MRLWQQAAELESVQRTATARDLIAVIRLTRAWVTDAEEFPPLAPLKRASDDLLMGTKWEKLLYCPWCVSFWVAGGALLFRRLFPRAWPVLASMLAASQVAGTVIELEEHFYA
jgi:hypothetical protein